MCSIVMMGRQIAEIFSKECVAVLTMLYKENGAVSSDGSGFLSDWALYLGTVTQNLQTVTHSFLCEDFCFSWNLLAQSIQIYYQIHAREQEDCVMK